MFLEIMTSDGKLLTEEELLKAYTAKVLELAPKHGKLRNENLHDKFHLDRLFQIKPRNSQHMS